MGCLDNPGQPVSFSGIATSCLVFLLMGALQSLYGPAIPYLIKRFAITTAQAGMAMSVHFAGALAGVMLFHQTARALGFRSTVTVSFGLVLVGCLVFATATAWSVALVGALVIGFGIGGCDVGLNHLFVTHCDGKGMAMVNLLNAHFGLGSIAAPILIGWLGARHYPAVFLGCGLCCIPPLVFRKHLTDPPLVEAELPRPARGGVATMGIMAAFFLIYALYMGIETGVGGWESESLEAIGAAPAWAATATSFYWLAFTGGCFLAAGLGLALSHAKVMVLGSLGMTASLMVVLFAALTARPWLEAGGYIGVGLSVAPLFPTGLAWLGQIMPSSGGAVASAIALSMVGGMIFPTGFGALIERFGMASVPFFMALLAGLCLAATVYIIRKS
jgi:fucose permease